MNDLSTEPKMTIKEVASILNVSERVCQIAIKKLYSNVVKNGKTTYLSEYQVTRLKLELQKHHNLEGTFEVKTQLEKQLLIQQAMNLQQEMIVDLTKENSNLKIENSEMKPKVSEYDLFMKSESSQSFGDVAKILKIGRNSLFKILREKKILMSNNVPYQEYMKYFEVIEKPIKIGKDVVNKPVTLVNPKGISYISKKIILN